jgi:Mn-dependent DtxR family transcriptional regulator
MVAVSPATLQRELRKLAEAGLVELGYRRIRVPDRAGLAGHGQS